jgi:hypothetical protein
MNNRRRSFLAIAGGAGALAAAGLLKAGSAEAARASKPRPIPTP